jgi:hypothetical protein
MSLASLKREIEFIGGPVDGRVDRVPAPPCTFVGVVSPSRQGWRVRLRSLLRFFRCVSREKVRLAVYELEEGNAAGIYQYRGTQVVEDRFEPSRHRYIPLTRRRRKDGVNGENGGACLGRRSLIKGQLSAGKGSTAGISENSRDRE